MRSLLFVSPHFPPDSAAGTHRARLLTPYLSKFGWEPTVLTVSADSIEGDVDAELAATIPSDLRVVRVPAWSPQWTRRAGFGDLGLRAFRALGGEARRLVRTEQVDAVLVTTYPTYPAMIGAALKRRYRTPFVLDLQDPWVGAWGRDVGPGGTADLRSRVSRAIATAMEPRVVTAADALMSVTERTMAELVERVPSVAALPRREVPIGWEPADWSRVRSEAAPNTLFSPTDGCIHLCAVGTILPTAIGVLETFLDAVAHLGQHADTSALRIWFVGTSNQSGADRPATVAPRAAARHVDGMVSEQSARVPYFDALRILRDAHGVIVLGSGEPHYAPSKVFPALASRKPVLACLHPDSPARQLLAAASRTRPVELISSIAPASNNIGAIADALGRMMRLGAVTPPPCDSEIAPFTGEHLAEQVAELLDRACER